MRGLPVFIQTRKDLNNLFALSKEGKVDGGELAGMIRVLLGRQYHQVPILEAEGTLVKTLYFPEVSEGSATAEGMTVKAVVHVEDTEDEANQFSHTEITLSKKAPAEMVALTIVKDPNPLVEMGFDIDEINYILGVLENA